MGQQPLAKQTADEEDRGVAQRVQRNPADAKRGQLVGLARDERLRANYIVRWRRSGRCAGKSSGSGGNGWLRKYRRRLLATVFSAVGINLHEAISDRAVVAQNGHR